MRTIGVTLLVLAVLAGGATLALPRLIDPAHLHAQIMRQAEELTGGTVTSRGEVVLEILPWPSASITGVTIGGEEGAGGAMRLEVGRADLRLRPLPLLHGEIEVDAATLLRPVLHLPELADGTPLPPLEPPPLRRVNVVNGTVVFTGTGEPAHRLDAIDVELEAAGERGPFSLRGGFEAAGQAFHVSARLGRVSPEAQTTLQLELDTRTPRPEALRLAFRGVVSAGETPELRGQLTLAGNDLPAGSQAVAAALGGTSPELPEWLAMPYALSGTLASQADAVRIGDLQLTFGGTEAQGGLELSLVSPTPAFKLTLSTARLTLPDELAVGDHLLPLLSALPPWLSGEIDLTTAALGFRGADVRRVRLTLALPGDGSFAIPQARAVLPGNADLSFRGRLGASGPDAALEGSLVLVTERLRTLLQWLDLDPPEVPPGRMQSLSLQSDLALSQDSVRLSQARLRLDAARLEGSFALEQGPRPRVAAAVRADRLNLDAYAPGTTPAAALATLQGWLERVDVALQAEIGRLIAQGRHWSDAVIEGRSLGGVLALERLAARGEADGEAELAGEVDFPGQRLRLEGVLRAPRPALLLSRFGLQPPVSLARLTPLELRGRAEGWRDDLRLELNLEVERAAVAVTGSAAWPEQEPPSLQLDLDGAHPHYAALLETLALAAPGGSGIEEGPLELTGRLRGRIGEELAFTGTAALGPTQLTGQIGWQEAAPRPRWDVRLSLNQPQLATLLPPLALFGLQPDRTVLAGPLFGNWPRQPFQWGWLHALDARLELTGRGGLAGDGMEMIARIEERGLTVERFSTDALGGRIELEARLDAAGAAPLLALTLGLRGIDPAALAIRLDVPPVLQGAADLRMEASALALTPFDLMRSLMGHATVELHDGRLSGLKLEPAAPEAAGAPESRDRAGGPAELPLSKLEGRFDIHRGIATAQPVTLDLRMAHGEVEGAIDLLLWTADLTVELTPEEATELAPVSIRIAGPLDRAQVVQRRPTAVADPRDLDD